MDIVELSRLQFAFTAMVHFLFVPLTLGMSILLAIMESVYVMTGKTIYRQMTKFWGKLFGINFALGGYRRPPPLQATSRHRRSLHPCS